jgi:hypothetical protein
VQNFNRLGPPLNLLQSLKKFTGNFFSVIGTRLRGESQTFQKKFFFNGAMGHPNIYEEATVA